MTTTHAQWTPWSSSHATSGFWKLLSEQRQSSWGDVSREALPHKSYISQCITPDFSETSHLWAAYTTGVSDLFLLCLLWKHRISTGTLNTAIIFLYESVYKRKTSEENKNRGKKTRANKIKNDLNKKQNKTKKSTKWMKTIRNKERKKTNLITPE